MATNKTKGAATREMGYPISYAYGGHRREFVAGFGADVSLMALQRMWDTDETLGAMAWVVEATLAQVEWSHVPQVDGKDSNDPEAVKRADYMDQCLMDMKHTFSDHVEEATTMIPLGFAPCEIVLKQRRDENSRFPDGFYGFDRLPLRDQHSVTQWLYDDSTERDLIGMQQMGQQTAEIPIWKLLHYRTSSRLGNPYGRSLLISAYRPWYLKRKIQDSEAIGIDRELAGMPTFYIPQADLDAAADVDAEGKPTPKALAAQSRIQGCIKAVRDLRFNDAGGLVIPSDVFKDDQGKPSTVRKYEFKLVTGGGQRAIDARTAIKDYDRSMARSLLFQFLHLGDRSGGSYALSDNQSDLALRSLRAITMKIAREYRQKALPLIWFVNGWDPKYMPRLEPSPIAEDSIEQLGLFLERIAGAEPMFLDRPDLLEAVLNRAGLRQARRQQAEGQEGAVGEAVQAQKYAKIVQQVLAAMKQGGQGADEPSEQS